MIDFDNKVLVSKLITHTNKLMVKSGMLAMNEKSLEVSISMVLKLNELISIMRETKEAVYESDIQLLENVIATYEGAINNLRSTINEEENLRNEYSKELEYMINTIKNNIKLKDK